MPKRVDATTTVCDDSHLALPPPGTGNSNAGAGSEQPDVELHHMEMPVYEGVSGSSSSSSRSGSSSSRSSGGQPTRSLSHWDQICHNIACGAVAGVSVSHSYVSLCLCLSLCLYVCVTHSLTHSLTPSLTHHYSAPQVLAKTAVAPAERVKMSFQTTQDRFKFSTALSRARGMVQEAGVLSLWRGHSTTVLRVAPFAGLSYAVHDWSEREMKERLQVRIYIYIY
eukprot:GSChrysophyteH2.ASY1.ANO1.965.1 assembled CDS